MKIFTASTLRFLLVLAYLLFASSLQAKVILYPGTFDLFHKSHYDELNAAISEHPDAKAIVLPIASAYYNELGGVLLPDFFPLPLRQMIIEAGFRGDPRVTVSNKLARINGDVFGTILQVARSFNDRETYILVGADVVERWQTLAGFDAFLQQVKLIVNEDPRYPESFKSLQAALKGKGNILFRRYTVEGFRSFQVNQTILFDFNAAKSMLPPKIFDFLTAHPEFAAVATQHLLAKLPAYVDAALKTKVLPALSESGLPASILAHLMEQRPFLLSLLESGLLSQPPSTELAQKIADQTKQSPAEISRLFGSFQPTPALIATIKRLNTDRDLLRRLANRPVLRATAASRCLEAASASFGE